MEDKTKVVEQKKFVVRNLGVAYGGRPVLQQVNLDLLDKRVTALIGPSGCGKTTFLRCLNNMNSFDDECVITGSILLDGQEIAELDGSELRTRVGMVFQKPNPFPQSIYDNIAYGPRIHSMFTTKQELDDLVADSLVAAGLYDEVSHDLHKSANKLSGGQQQRLCIARALAVNPEVLLMDEPCSSLDPRSTSKIEELIERLSENLAVVLVTHSMEQASRIADWTAFFCKGTLVEYSTTAKMFTAPAKKATLDYVTRRFSNNGSSA